MLATKRTVPTDQHRWLVCPLRIGEIFPFQPKRHAGTSPRPHFLTQHIFQPPRGFVAGNKNDLGRPPGFVASHGIGWLARKGWFAIENLSFCAATNPERSNESVNVCKIVLFTHFKHTRFTYFRRLKRTEMISYN